MNWSAYVPDEVAHKRAGGRKHYNSCRQFMALHRRLQVSELLAQYGLLEHGVQARIARELKVSESTISRDIRALLHRHTWCPRCGSWVPRDQLEAVK